MTVQPDNKTITGTKSATKRVVIEKDQDEQQAIGLLENAVDFFKRAMSAIDSDPKESIINFYTAVELILKFPLMLEHWSLIVTGKPIKKDYIKGDFQSPTFKETCERLEGVFDVTMDSETKSILDSVRKHRNTMVHYYHHNLNENKGAKELTEEQARAWFKLNSFLKTNSKKLNIEPYQQELDILEKELFAYSQYAEQKYISLKPKIEGLEKTGVTFDMCYDCNQKSLQITEDDIYVKCTCLVCDSTDSGFQVKCPECHSNQILHEADDFECKSCYHFLNRDFDIFELLDEARPNFDPDDNKPDATPANCIECEIEDSVCLHKGKYLCIHCWKVSLEIYRCGYCNEPMNIDVEDSHFYGCPFCEGYMSHVMSKD